MHATQLFNLVKNNEIQIIKNKLTAEMIDCNDQQGNTLLMIASGLGHSGIVKLLLDMEANVNIIDKKCGYSALHLACQNGSIEIAELLLSAGAHINQQIVCNGMTPLMNAVWYRKPLLVKYLLSQTNINLAIRAHFGAKAEDLISASSVANPATPDNHIPKEDAIASEMRNAFNQYHKIYHPTQLIQELIKQGALIENNLALLKTYEKDIAEINRKTALTNEGNDAHTALHIAARDGLVNVVAQLLAAGANVAVEDGYMFSTPLHKAAYMGHDKIIKALSTHPNFNHILNSQGPCNGYTALHDATWHGHINAVNALLELGADKKIKGYDGKTAYDLAIEYGYTDIRDLLPK